MKDIDTNLLKIFVAAAEKQNFREAAEELLMTQPAVTKSIHKLEKQLNLTLFDRVQQRVQLNANGYFFLLKAKQMLALETQIQGELEGFQLGLTDRVKLGVAPQIANSMLPLIIKQFREDCPQVFVQIEIMPSNEIGEAVFRQQIDIGLSKMASTRDLITMTVVEEPVVLVTSTRLEQEQVEKILQKTTIYTHAYSPYWEKIARQLPGYCRIEQLNQTEVIKTFVKHGLGVAFLPKSVVQTEMMNGELYTVESDISKGITSTTYLHMKYSHGLFEKFVETCRKVY